MNFNRSEGNGSWGHEPRIGKLHSFRFVLINPFDKFFLLVIIATPVCITNLCFDLSVIALRANFFHPFM